MAGTSNPTSGKCVGFIEIPDDALDLLSHFTQTEDGTVNVVCSKNQDSYALRMAEILQLPTLDFPNRMSLLGCDLIVVGNQPPNLIDEIREMMQGTETQILSVPEALNLILGDSDQLDDGSKLFPDEIISDEFSEESPQAPADPSSMEEPAVDETTGFPSRELGFDAASLLGADLQAEVGSLLLDTSRGDLLNKILSIAIRATHTQTGSIMLVDEGGQQLRIAVAKGLPPDVVASVRQPIGQGVSGEVFSSGKPRLLTGKVKRDPDLERKLRPQLRESAVVPIFSDDRPIGILSVNAETSESKLTERSLLLLQRFAKEVSSAILKSLNLTQLQGDSRREALMRQVERIMALDEGLPHRINAVAEALRKAFDADIGQAFLADPLGRRLELVTGRPTSRVWVPMEKGLLGWVAKDGVPRVMESWSKDGNQGVATYFVPIMGDSPRGILVLENATLLQPGADRYLATLGEIMERVAEMIEVEKSLEAQELFSQLKSRVEEQGPRFSGLLPHERARAVLDFVRDLLGAETATWKSPSDLKTVWARPDSSHAATLQSGMRPLVDDISAWIAHRGEGAGGLDLPGWDTHAPEGPGPYLGIDLPHQQGVLILVFSPDEVGGTPIQVPAHILFECLNQVGAYLPRGNSQKAEAA